MVHVDKQGNPLYLEVLHASKIVPDDGTSAGYRRSNCIVPTVFAVLIVTNQASCGKRDLSTSYKQVSKSCICEGLVEYEGPTMQYSSTLK